MAPGYPKLIGNDWDGLPGHLDAGFTWTNNKTYFFRSFRISRLFMKVFFLCSKICDIYPNKVDCFKFFISEELSIGDLQGKKWIKDIQNQSGQDLTEFPLS